MEQSKICTKCNIDKPLSQYYKDKRKKDKLTNTCKSCRSILFKEWSSKNPEKLKIARAITQSKTKEYHSRPEIKLRNKDKVLKRAFGITLEEYNKKLIEQNNVCDICRKPETSKRYKYLAVDHCHKTNQVRGLLCNRCNRAIGMLQDNIQLLFEAIEYIKKHQKNEA